MKNNLALYGIKVGIFLQFKLKFQEEISILLKINLESIEFIVKSHQDIPSGKLFSFICKKFAFKDKPENKLEIMGSPDSAI